MSPLLATLIAVSAVSAISLVGITALSWNQRVLRGSLFFLVSLAAGALFGDAFIHLIPESLEELADPTTAALLVLAGILMFFVLEKVLHWHHSHGCADDPDMCEREEGHRVRPLGWLILVSDGLHNLIDGMIIAASFLVSVELGIATTIAIALHEIPQEISDFALLVHAGFSRGRALLVNFASALTAFAGVVLVFALADASASLVPVVTALSAGAFIYIAGSDLVPELHKTTALSRSILQLVAIVLGIAIMVWLTTLENGAHGDEEHAHDENAAIVFSTSSFTPSMHG